MRIAVVGATGNVGSAALRLLAQDAHVGPLATCSPRRDDTPVGDGQPTGRFATSRYGPHQKPSERTDNVKARNTILAGTRRGPDVVGQARRGRP